MPDLLLGVDGGKVVAFETYTTSDKDFSAQLTKIKAAAPELVFLPSYYSDVPLQLQQAHRLGITVPFLGSDSWSSPEIIKLAGQDAEGAYFCNHYSPGAKNEITGRFVVSYKKKYGQEPDDVAALTYDAFGVLAKAIASAGKRTTRPLTKLSAAQRRCSSSASVAANEARDSRSATWTADAASFDPKVSPMPSRHDESTTAG